MCYPSGVIVVNAEHWLDEDGEIPRDAPPGLFRNAMLMTQCINECKGKIMLSATLETNYVIITKKQWNLISEQQLKTLPYISRNFRV